MSRVRITVDISEKSLAALTSPGGMLTPLPVCRLEELEGEEGVYHLQHAKYVSPADAQPLLDVGETIPERKKEEKEDSDAPPF